MSLGNLDLGNLDLGFLTVLAADAGGLVTSGFTSWAAWVILFTPLLVAFLVTAVPAIRKNNYLAAALSIGSVGLGLVLTLVVYFFPMLSEGGNVYEHIVSWVAIGDSALITFGTRMDALAVTMTLVVTGVGFAIFVFALGYMKGDESMGRFYGKFALFVFSMLGIVMSPNFFQTFIFWELVGVSSYLLIGYYWKKHSAGEAAKKAFMTNRVGDFGFLLGILMVWAAVGDATGAYGQGLYSAFDFTVIEKAIAGAGGLSELFWNNIGFAAIAAALIFCGAMGKSAQFPLHVWLPDAMEGPTPVSALMHAATMVAAGIYLVIRCNFIFAYAEWAPTLICWIGGITAFIAASMAITQNDIKKVLAYSTLSQLGYMTMALGAGAYTAAMFHLTTHAFFKALLFLCAGSVIHGCHHEQDMLKMGGIKKYMPSTHKTWVIGTLALCGIFPLAGFWSKDEILGAASSNTSIGMSATILWGVGTLVAFMTAFYMGRAWFMTFRGKYRGEHEPHESPKVMTIPLWILAIFSIFIGFVGVPGEGNLIEHFLHSWHVGGPAQFHMSVALISTIVAILGLVLAFKIYGKGTGKDPLPEKLGGLWTLWANLWYIDRFYLWLVRVVQQGIAKLCWWFERWVVIQGLFNATARGTRIVGEQVRQAHTGRLGSYVTSFVLGAVIVMILVLVQVKVGGGS